MRGGVGELQAQSRRRLRPPEEERHAILVPQQPRVRRGDGGGHRVPCPRAGSGGRAAEHAPGHGVEHVGPVGAAHPPGVEIRPVGQSQGGAGAAPCPLLLQLDQALSHLAQAQRGEVTALLGHDLRPRGRKVGECGPVDAERASSAGGAHGTVQQDAPHRARLGAPHQVHPRAVRAAHQGLREIAKCCEVLDHPWRIAEPS